MAGSGRSSNRSVSRILFPAILVGLCAHLNAPNSSAREVRSRYRRFRQLAGFAHDVGEAMLRNELGLQGPGILKG
jgi:hypothetical protein